ncbi:energy transducer TonB [Croceitalea marina]|uniref:Energy transducer TonB n=1 Tax=Croceitalea marina TaxID=1775166 RepID=A0ABW5MXS3_9FLAO
MMEAKKKEHLKLEKNSGLYFVIGMTLILALVYTALEWKTFDSQSEWDTSQTILKNLDEIPPLTIQKLPPPPKPKTIVTPEIKIAENDDDVIEDLIKSTESDSNKEIITLKDVDFEEPAPVVDEVSFMVIEDVPIFPGCEGADDKRACFQEKMQKHIRRNFRYPAEAQEMGLQGKVYLQFTVQKDGNIGSLKLRGPHKILENEASRIISKLPKMEPGKQRGQGVKVPFSIPITFRLQ